MSALPGGKSFKFKADTVIRFTPVRPHDTVSLGPGPAGIEPQYHTHYIRKNGVDVRMGNNLEVCSRSKFQRMYHDRGCGERWVAMAPEYSDKASPGDWVRRRWSDRRPSAPDGMVVAAIPAHQLDNEKPQFLILWFR